METPEKMKTVEESWRDIRANYEENFSKWVEGLSEDALKKFREKAKKILEDGLTQTEKEQKVQISESKIKEQMVRLEKDAFNSDDLSKLIKKLKKGVGLRLSQARNELGLTQENISDEFLKDTFLESPIITESMLSKWENGVNWPAPFYLIWFAQKYDVDLQWILTGIPQVPCSKRVKDVLNKIIETLESLKKAAEYLKRNI